MSEDPNDWGLGTKATRGGLARSANMEMAEALYLTQGYVYDSAESADARFSGEEPGFVYTRYGNPTVKMFEDRLALLDGAEACKATATGMAAMHLAFMGLVKAGDHVVAGRALFGSCRWIIQNWAPRFGVESTMVYGPDLDAWRAAVRPNTKLLFIETPANPLLEICDIAGVVALAREIGAKVVVDNVFATPDLPVAAEARRRHRLPIRPPNTSTAAAAFMGGAVLGGAALVDEAYKDLARHTGPALSPFNAWVLLKGLETLDLRVRAQARTAATLADLIADHPKAMGCRYPTRADHPQHAVAMRQMTGGGTVVALDLGSREGAFNFLNALEIVDISNNLGDAKSMATHPTTTTHRSMTEEQRLEVGVTPGWVRLSVGLEDVADLSRDIERALGAV